MPNANTFSCPPLGRLVDRYVKQSRVSVDPFSRNSMRATFTNDIDGHTTADHHMDAVAFLGKLAQMGICADLLILDPPYSPRQIKECYDSIGRTTTVTDTQNAALYRRVRNASLAILSSDATVISFGWNSTGMGKRRGFEMVELLLVCHGGAHNDTIAIVEQRCVLP